VCYANGDKVILPTRRRRSTGPLSMSRDTTRVVVVMVLWAACYPLITTGLEYAPHLTFAAMRAFVAAVVLLVIAAALRVPIPSGLRIWGWLCIAGFGSTTLGYFGMFHAAEFVAPGFATVIANTQPLIAAVLAYLFLRERLRPRARLGLLIGFLGVAVVAAPQAAIGDATATTKGIGYILLAATGVSIGNVAIKKLAGELDPTAAMGWQLLIGAFPLAVLSSLTETANSISWTPNFLFSLLVLSLFGTALAFWLWQSALTTMDLSRANAFSFLVPFLGLIFGAVFFGEPVALLAIAGAVLAVLGVRLVLDRTPRATKPMSIQAISPPERCDHDGRL